MAKPVRIGHSSAEIQPEIDVIMTLRDSSVLEPETTLENTQLTEIFKAEKRIEARKLARSQGVKHQYDGEETGERVLLAKYDDPLLDSESRGFDLSETGSTPLPAAPLSTSTPGESLNTPKTIASEFASFRKPRKRPRRGGDLLQGFADAPRTGMRDAFLANSKKATIESTPISLDDESKELQLSLSRQLRAAQKRNQPDAQLAVPSQPSVKLGTGPALTATKEFIDAVASERDRLEAQRLTAAGLGLKDSVSGTTSVVNVALPSERMAAEALLPSKLPDTATVELTIPAERDPSSQELFMGRGLAECLSLLRQRAALKDEKKKYGRATDVKREEQEDGEEGVKLEYRDEKGRLLSRKQAFRQQCYAFHNEKPSKNKTEKLLKRTKLEEDRAALEHSKGTTSFRAQKDVMAKTKQPFLVLPSAK